MKKYLITVVNKGVSVVLRYNESGQLVGFHIKGEFTQVFWEWIIKTMPAKEVNLKNFKAVKGLRVDEIPEDLSFNHFWNEYDLKVSNKKRSEQIWNSMSDADRSAALVYLNQYNNYLIKNPGVSKKHADTYLRQQIWNN